MLFFIIFGSNQNVKQLNLSNRCKIFPWLMQCFQSIIFFSVNFSFPRGISVVGVVGGVDADGVIGIVMLHLLLVSSMLFVASVSLVASVPLVSLESHRNQ